MYFRSSHLSLAILLLACAAVQAQSQSANNWSDWQTLTPEGEEFSVLIPRNPTIESEKFSYHKMELTGRLYLASMTGGPVFAVTSFSGIKSAPALYTELERFNSYADAFKTWFPGKIRGKDSVVKLVQVGTKIFHGYSGREYKLTIGDLIGTVEAYATRKRFYAIVYLNTKLDQALQEKFLGSFVLPERPAVQSNTSTTAANVAPEVEAAPGQISQDVKREPATSNSSARNSEYSPEGVPEAAGVSGNSDTSQPKQKRSPISGGMLNSKAIYLPLPEPPAGDSAGVVLVQILIDEQGTVIEARAVAGPANLQSAAVSAAKMARFTPTLLEGEPVKVSGVLSYSFARSN